MRTHPYLAGGVAAVLSFVVLTTVAAAESRKLAAPVYPSAVPAVPADSVQANPELVLGIDSGKTLDCAARTRAGDGPGPWCFLTRDPIEKVKAFYEKSTGTMYPVRNDAGAYGYQAFAERAWFPGEGEAMPAGYYYTGVSVHALPAPPVKGQQPAPAAMGDETWAGQEDFGFYAQTRFFGDFLDAVDMFGDPSKRPVSDLDKLYSERNKLESAIFQRKGPAQEAVDATLKNRYGELRGQRQQAAYSGTMSAYTQHGAQASQRSVGPTADENARFNDVMGADPALQQRYVALTQQAMTLMQQGKDEEADEVFAQIDELEQQHPDLAAQSRQQQARVARAQADDKAAEDAIRASGENQLDQAIWGTGLEMLDALDKEAYYTLVVIDNAFSGSEKDYSRDRATIEAETKGTIPHPNVGLFNIDYPDTRVADGAQPQQPAPENKESLGGKLKKGFGRLKDLGGD